MIRHYLKLIWNQRRKQLGLSFEILFSFLVLFAVFSVSVYFFKNYLHPLGFEYEEVWRVGLGWTSTPHEEREDMVQLFENQLATYPEIVDYSIFGGPNTPFSLGTMTGEVRDMEGENPIMQNTYYVDHRLAETLNIPLVEGTWLAKEDWGKHASKPKVVITEDMREHFFGEGTAVGKKIKRDNTLYEVKGVTPIYRGDGDLEDIRAGAFFPMQEDQADIILLKLQPGTGAAFEADLVRKFRAIAPHMSFNVEYLDEMRRFKMNFRLIPILILGIIGLFLIFNVALGLFGVLWQNISRRKEEIGIRRAMGSTKGKITTQFIGEILVLATLSLILGIFFAVQFPLLNVFEVKAGIYFSAIGLAILTIYVLVVICAFAPSSQAAQLHPAIALREE